MNHHKLSSIVVFGVVVSLIVATMIFLFSDIAATLLKLHVVLGLWYE